MGIGISHVGLREFRAILYGPTVIGVGSSRSFSNLEEGRVIGVLTAWLHSINYGGFLPAGKNSILGERVLVSKEPMFLGQSD
jgi:hypothetical protein